MIKNNKHFMINKKVITLDISFDNLRNLDESVEETRKILDIEKKNLDMLFLMLKLLKYFLLTK